VLSVCLGSANANRADQSESFKAFMANWENAQKAYSAKEYGRAATLYAKVCELIPFEPTSHYQLACCHAHLGDKDKAVAALDAAIRFGWDDPQKLELADEFKDLRNHPRFVQLVKEAAVCRDEDVVVYAGKGVDPTKPAAVLVVLQGLGAGPRAELPYWKPAVDRLGMVLVAPRGVTKARSMMYSWHRRGARNSSALDYFDTPAAGKRIAEAIARAKKQFSLDGDRVVLAGFSQGAGVALRMLGDHSELFCGAVAVCGLYQPPGIAYWQSSARKHSRRVFMIAGKLDPLLQRSQKAMEELRAAGVTGRYEEEERMGHEYPPAYADRLQRAIEFVLARERSQ
jgi:predicted esterase